MTTQHRSPFSIYSDPARLLAHTLGDGRLWRRAWLANALATLIVLAMLAAAALIGGQPVALISAAAVSVMVPLMIVVSAAITTTGHPQLWLLQLCAPPTLLCVLLAGLGPLWPGAWLLSVILLTPALLGALVACACAVHVFNQGSRLLREEPRRRQAGQPSGLAAPHYQNRARTFRLVVAMLAAGLAGLFQLLFVATNPRDSILIGLALLVFAGACLRLEATLLCWLGWPLLMHAGQAGWRATYAGRWALFAPVAALNALLTAEQRPARVGAALHMILHEGCLAPAIRRVVARLTPAQADLVALGLSLQSGGAAIRYLEPAYARVLPALPLLYARLAEEATRPADMQRWLTVLHGHADVRWHTAPALAQTLATVDLALQCYTYDPVIDRAAELLREQIAMLACADDVPDATGAWPEALLKRVTAQARLLKLHKPDGMA